MYSNFLELGGCTLNEEIRTKQNIMSLQTITFSPYQAQAIGEVWQTNDDFNRRAVNRRRESRRTREVTYPVPIAFRVLHWFFVTGVVTIIGMLMLGL
jgi:hypothetical protein